MPVAVITGSTSGIGLATATLLVERGYSVVLHGNSRLLELHSVCDALNAKLAAGAGLISVAADVSSEQGCRHLVQSAFQWRESIDLWVNNAGADVLTGSLRDQPFESKLQRLIDVDLMGTVRLSRSVADRMVAGGQPSAAGPLPSIINIGWDQAMLGMEGDSGQLFCTVKAAVMAFTSALSLSVAPHIRVNAVAPGWIRTAWGTEVAGDYWNTRASAESQMNRWGTPREVAETICWLASPAASFISGQTVCVNGGRRYCSAKPEAR